MEVRKKKTKKERKKERKKFDNEGYLRMKKRERMQYER